MSQIVDTRTKEVVGDALKLLENKGWPELPIDLDPPIGDFAIICFPAAKTLKKDPSVIAEELALELNELDVVASTSVEKGYCNINLKWDDFANKLVDEISNESYGKGEGKKEKGSWFQCIFIIVFFELCYNFFSSSREYLQAQF